LTTARIYQDPQIGRLDFNHVVHRRGQSRWTHENDRSNHPARSKREGEVFYGRVGFTRFTGVRSLEWTKQGAPARDANGELDWDAIDSFTWLGTRHRLEGRFGEIEVDAEDLECVLIGPE
jgi:hypothetical protein